LIKIFENYESRYGKKWGRKKRKENLVLTKA
jgi:hypothetical protein